MSTDPPESEESAEGEQQASGQSTGEMTFVEHLVEMRDRLLRVVLSVLGFLVVLFPFANDLYAVLAERADASPARRRQHDRHTGGVTVFDAVQAEHCFVDFSCHARHPLSVMGLHRAGFVQARAALDLSASGYEFRAFLPGHGLSRISSYFR